MPNLATVWVMPCLVGEAELPSHLERTDSTRMVGVNIHVHHRLRLQWLFLFYHGQEFTDLVLARQCFPTHLPNCCQAWHLCVWLLRPRFCFSSTPCCLWLRFHTRNSPCPLWLRSHARSAPCVPWLGAMDLQGRQNHLAAIESIIQYLYYTL